MISKWFSAPTHAPNQGVFRDLRAQLVRKLSPMANRILISSSFDRQGKSALALGLGLAFSEEQGKALLIDGDLRRGGLTQQLNPDLQGLNQLAFDSTTLLNHLPQGLDFIAAGPPVNRSPLDILTDPQLLAWLGQHWSNYDAVIIDSPSLQTSLDALKLASFCPYCLFVSQKSSFQGLTEGNHCEDLRDQGTEILGIVLTS
jgi:Mrp family chromosome partitioning ATPase